MTGKAEVIFGLALMAPFPNVSRQSTPPLIGKADSIFRNKQQNQQNPAREHARKSLRLWGHVFVMGPAL